MMKLRKIIKEIIREELNRPNITFLKPNRFIPSLKYLNKKYRLDFDKERKLYSFVISNNGNHDRNFISKDELQRYIDKGKAKIE